MRKCLPLEPSTGIQRPNQERSQILLSYRLRKFSSSHIHIVRWEMVELRCSFALTSVMPGRIQPCPAPPATITGTITAADVSPNIPATLAARNQGLNTGEFDEFLEALRAGALYVNVHSTTWPGGEIRSQIDHDHGKGQLKR